MKNKNAIKILVACCLALGTNAVFANFLSNDSTKTATTQNASVPDSQITNTFTSSVKNDPITKDTTVKTTVSNGVITLSGEAQNDAEADSLISKAESTQGVTDTNTDNLTVKDSKQPLDDTIITAKIKGLFVKNQLMNEAIAVPSLSVHVETQNGHVLLTGKVKTDAQKQKAQEIAKSVTGVKAVKSNLEINPS